MSSSASRSPSKSSRGNERSPSPKRESKRHKLYATNLDANSDIRKLEDELRQLFSKYGDLSSIVVKRSHNNEYCFAFIDYKEGEDASIALDKLNGTDVGGKSMKVEFQEDSKRRKITSAGECYKCGKPGHFARECRSERYEQRRGRSRSRSKDRKKKKSRRHRSESSESVRAKKKDKDRKKHKSHKKHKKSKKKQYSSQSESSD